MGFFSRHVRERFLYPSPLCDRDAYLESVLRKADLTSKPVLFAFSDSTLVPLLSNLAPQSAPWNWMPPSSMESFDKAFDKLRTLELARRLGIDAPATYAEPSGAELSAFVKRHRWPLVVKPRRSVYWQEKRGVQMSATFATSAADLALKSEAVFAQTGEFPLVQEYIRGEEASVQFLCEEGRVLAACANRRLRSASPLGGVGALKETIPLSYHGLGERGQSLASALKWSGPIMVEFKIDRENSIPKLMEINGRFWGSLPLAVLAGVDFPYLHYRLAQGLAPGPAAPYCEGIVSRHFLGDLHHLHSVFFKRDPMRKSVYPSRLRALRDFLVLPKGCKSDVLDFSDIRPVFAELIDTGSRLFAHNKSESLGE
jgi:predicted ATP-grasp superfamily ATP-dependent carboligase